MRVLSFLSKKPTNLKKSLHPPKRNTRKVFLSKLSQSFLLPIAILPFAGILLALGGAIGSNFDSQGAQDFANFLKGMSDVIFANLPVLFAVSISIYFTTKNRMYSGFMVIIAYLCFNGVQSAFIHVSSNGDFQNIFYFHTDQDLQYLVTKSLGISSLQTSVFGGIIVGFIVVFVMNRWSDIELPVSLNFFSGIKFVPMILIPANAFLAIITLIIWPFFGLAISWLGNITNDAPAGLEVLLYGIFSKSLLPFGLHHILNGLAGQSSLGGSITEKMIIDAGERLGISNEHDFIKILNQINNETWNGSVVGDVKTWSFINSLPVNHVPINNRGMSVPVFDWFADYVGVYAGRFIQEYPTYLGVYIGIGFALIFASHRKNRKKTMAMIGTSTLVVFVTSITEPLDFSFLFVAPLLYYLVLAPFSGISYMLMKISGAHVGSTITLGIFDLFIYGAIPASKGTRFWVVFPYAVIEGIITFLLFYFSIKKFDFKTPGREINNSEKINPQISKKIAEKDNIDSYLEAYGGIDNLVSVSACASRLRIEVVDPKKINKKRLIELGSQGFIEKENMSQNVMGGKADIIAGKINDLEYFKNES